MNGLLDDFYFYMLGLFDDNFMLITLVVVFVVVDVVLAFSTVFNIYLGLLR